MKRLETLGNLQRVEELESHMAAVVVVGEKARDGEGSQRDKEEAVRRTLIDPVNGPFLACSVRLVGVLNEKGSVRETKAELRVNTRVCGEEGSLEAVVWPPPSWPTSAESKA